MRLPCPFCGPRDSAEFAYLGDADATRPAADTPDAGRAFFEAVYLRDNPAGRHREFWYHAAGCRQWLVVERDTLSHEIFAAHLARPA
ncbi:sarcosine oxidase subunit delta [Zavarzinia sp.]|uniref:sarcosine oxidase subunit delta n=1 Tax=Zavarzinia sp. TaxID=2027920 RepID=UPI003566011B